MKINFFSPLPNLRTDIANMSASVLLELGKLAELRAWTPQPDWAASLGATYEVRRFDPDNLPLREFNWADINFFNLGNDARFHKEIFGVSRMLPGVQILHDVRLAHFFGAFAEGDAADREYYLSEMTRAGLRSQAERFLAGTLTFDAFSQLNSMLAAALRPAIGGILHHEAAFAEISGATETPLFVLPICLAHPLRPTPPRVAPLTDQARIVRLILFGFIGQNRCLPEILQALAGVAGRENYILDIYGPLEQPEPIEQLVQRLGLQAQVVRHGFVEDAVLDAALAQAELAINLRNPTMGEASGSQLRIWENALPALVSNVGWYANLPRDAVFHIEPGNEIAGIQAHLGWLRQDPARYRQVGKTGRGVLERDHLPATYARSLLRVAEQAPAMFGRKTAIGLARRSADLLLELTEGGELTGLTRSVATEIFALNGLGASPNR